MANAVVGTGHQVSVSLMREDVPKPLDTACSRRLKNHCRNGLSPRGHARPIPETNNNNDKSVNCDLDKMRDRSILTSNGDCDHETVSGDRKRGPMSAFDSVVNGEAGRSRKRRRKNCRPRSLMQLSRDETFLKEDLEEYHVNNNGVDFYAVAADDEEEILDLSCCVKKQENVNGCSNGECGGQLVDDTPAVVSPLTCGESKVFEEDGTRLVALDNKNEDEEGDNTSGVVATVPSGSDTPGVVETVPSGSDTPGVVETVLSGSDTPGVVETVPSGSDTPQVVETVPSGSDTPGVVETVPSGSDTPGMVETVPSGSDTPQVVETVQSDDDSGMVETVPSGADAAVAIKDYAESTMNELLSIYGLNEDHAEAITRRVPLLNFSPSNILGREQKNLPSGTLQITHLTNSSLSSDALTRSVEAKFGQSSGVAVSAASPSLATEGIYAKFMDSMEKLAQMPRGSIIGSPPVLLPLKQEMLSRLSDAPGTAMLPVRLSPFQGKPTVANSFTTSSAYIKACFDSSLAPKSAGSASPDGRNLLPNYGKYMKRYEGGENCGEESCNLTSFKEHFHCLDCHFKVFLRKEEMIRHFKWHKKRDESLQHGFMRYSPLDSCEGKFGSCTHDGRQTHYHCLQPACNKVYISTSDVQMHANYHRKNSAIAQEGFQRFRATEDCGSPLCVFYGQRTTHFHCQRPQCNYTFKNKADMEKHKMYHQRDELLAKDGFKKFMKYESCGYDSCRYSNSSNHIHCIRLGCDYVLHSTGQLYSHKRKHERRDFENAYKTFKAQRRPVKIAPTPPRQPVMVAPAISQPSPRHPGAFNSEECIGDLVVVSQSGSLNGSESSSPRALSMAVDLSLTDTPGNSNVLTTHGVLHSAESDSPVGVPIASSSLPQLGSTLEGASLEGDELGDSLSLCIPSYDDDKHISVDDPVDGTVATSDGSSPNCATFQPDFMDGASSMFVPSVNERKEKNDLWKKYLTRYTANDPCFARCKLLYKDHYHCSMSHCNILFRSKDGVHEHAKSHEQQERLTALCYMTYDTNISCDPSCPYNRRQTHYHCLWVGCNQVLTDDDPVFSRLDHQKVHEYARGVVSRRIFPSTPRVTVDAMRRRRGRPPKFSRSLTPVVPKTEMTEDEIQRLVLSLEVDTEARRVISCGFKRFDRDNLCPDGKCMFVPRGQHYHCLRQRCHFATDRRDMLNLHARDFHSFVDILEGFQFFDRSVNCRRAHCHNNHVRRHFHCMRARCDYSFVRYSTMIQHDKKHLAAGAERSSLLQRKVSIGMNGVAVTPHTLVASNLSKMTRAHILGAIAQSSSKPRDIRPLVPLIAQRGVPQIQNALSQTPGGAAPVAVSTSSPLVQQQVGRTPISLASPSVVNVSSAVVIPVASVSTQKDIASGVTLSAVSPTLLMTTNPVSSNFVTIAPKPSPSKAPPLTSLVQQPSQPVGMNVMSPQLSWLTLKLNMHYGMHQNCGRPFCKLKKKDHYHCFECNQAFSNHVRLKMHVAKHGAKSASATSLAQCDKSPVEGDACGGGDANMNLASSLNLSLTTFSNVLSKDQHSLNEDNDSDGLVIDLSLPTSECDDSCATPANVDDDKNDISDIHQVECQLDAKKECDVSEPAEVPPSSTGRRQDGVPDGYKRFRHVEDCGFTHCTYCHTVTHYHCERPACSHAFSDRARTQQHTERHRRTDAVMGDDFEHFRVHVDCRHMECQYARVTSHYHCRRCPFVCTDTAKVIAHRKHHLKLKNVAVQGYRKFTKREACSFQACIYSRKQCHYHCMKKGCSLTLLGLAQMIAHKKKHGDG